MVDFNISLNRLKDFMNKNIPNYMHDGILLYLEHGIKPGSFLYYIICNDLVNSIGSADINNKKSIFQYVDMIYNYFPSSAWGSKEKVEEWIKHCGFKYKDKNDL